MIEILISILVLFFIWNNPDSPYWIYNTKELKNNKALYEEKAKYFYEKFANPRKTWKGLDENEIFPSINTRAIN